LASKRAWTGGSLWVPFGFEQLLYLSLRDPQLVDILKFLSVNPRRWISVKRMTIEIPDDLADKIRPYEKNLQELIVIGLTQLRIQEALALFKRGNISLWKAARLADIPLREMIMHASAQGLKPQIDEQMKEEELT
jgi:predicted HTH domain antitoxin